MAEWELSKENIQPLKHGRKMATLNNVLQHRDEETQKLLAEERNVFEMELRTYSGTDPIDPWYRYITWVQQSYPKGGKEGNVTVLIEKCIKAFKDDREAQKDARYLEVWLSYAGMSSTPLDVYTFMYKNGMCTQQAGLYDAWAWHLETQGSYKSAESVYGKGMDALVDPDAKKGLAERKAQFQSRVMKRMKGEEIPPDEIEEQEQRKALGRLKAHGKHGKVTSIRVGSVKLGGPGMLPAKEPLKPSNTGGIKIFQDSAAPPATKAHSSAGSHSRQAIPSKEDYKENYGSAGKWNTAKGPKTVNIPLNQISQHAKLGFAVHEDEDAGQTNMTPHKVLPGESRVLTARKLDKEDVVHCPVALFETPDPTKNPAYCKRKVYQGATEFSFEEFRAASWKKREKARQEKLDMEKKKNDLLQMEKNLKEQQEQIAKQMEEFKKMMAMGIMPQAQNAEGVMPQVQPVMSVMPQGQPAMSVMPQAQPAMSVMPQAQPVVNVIRPSESDASSQNTSSADYSSRNISSAENSLKKSMMDDTAHLINANPHGKKTCYGNAISPNIHGRRPPSSQPSPTVNTKEAMAVMQQLWSTSDNESMLAVGRDPRPKPPAAPRFEIFSDPTQQIEPVHQQPAPAFEIFADPTQPVEPLPRQPAPFQIFSDDPAPVPTPAFQIYSDNLDKENAVPRTKSKLSPREFAVKDKENAPQVEIDENVPPKGFVQIKSARKTTGVLTPAENVEWMPLEEQERMLDEEEKREEDQAMETETPTPMPRPNIGNATLFVPEESEFDKMAKMSSTPFTGKQFIPFEDENTCAVEIFYKKTEVTAHIDDSLVMPPPPATNEVGPPPITPLSPIVETSREHYKSSSSSSGAETTRHGDHTNSKSHWGTTGLHSTTRGEQTKFNFGARTGDNTTGLGLSMGTRTPGQALMSGCMSGYAGDKSSMASLHHRTEPLRQENEVVKQLDMQDDDATGMFEMLAEFKQTLGTKPVPQPDQINQSLEPSFIENGHRDQSQYVDRSSLHATAGGVDVSKGIAMSRLSPRLDNTGVIAPQMAGLDLTDVNGTNANKSWVPAGAPPSLNLTDMRANKSGFPAGGAPSLDLTGMNSTRGFPAAGAPSLDLTGLNGTRANKSGFPAAGQPSLDLTGMNNTRANKSGFPAAGPPSLDITDINGTQANRSQFPAVGAPSLNLTDMNGTRADMAPSLNLTRDNSPKLGLTLNQTAAGSPALELTGGQAQLDMTTETKPPGGSVLNSSKINPFSMSIQESLLSQIAVPVNARHGYVQIDDPTPNVKVKSRLQLAEDRFVVTSLKGEGGFAKVYAATREETELDCTISGIDAVLKVQKPANQWEWYICTEVMDRIGRGKFSALQSSFMSIPRNYSFSDGGIFVSYHQELGNLLDLINYVKADKDIRAASKEVLAIYFTIEILHIMEALHSVGILHADIKADNFLLKGIPALAENAASPEEMFSASTTSLQLIDFGRAIDLTILPSNVAFDEVVETEGIKCVEMREGRSWREHIDYFGIASTVFCILFGSYMEVEQSNGMWNPKGAHYKRWFKASDLWTEFFQDFLNIKDTNKESLPSLGDWRRRFMNRFFEADMAKVIKPLQRTIGTNYY